MQSFLTPLHPLPRACSVQKSFLWVGPGPEEAPHPDTVSNFGKRVVPRVVRPTDASILRAGAGGEASGRADSQPAWLALRRREGAFEPLK